MMKSVDLTFDLAGSVAVITGGAGHLGFDMAEALAAAGASVVLSSRTLAQANKAAGRLRKKHRTAVLPLELDQRSWDSVQRFATAAIGWKKHVEILVNNAGGGSGQTAAHLFKRAPADIEDLIQTNLVGPIFCCKAFAEHMAARGRGKIINIASIAGLVGRDRRMYTRNGMNGQPIDYAAAKAGVIGMTRDLAGLLSPLGIHVNCISPGGFGPRDLPPGFVADYSDRTPVGHMGRDGIDIKGAILYLASPASDYVTGHNLVVDGGFSIWH